MHKKYLSRRWYVFFRRVLRNFPEQIRILNRSIRIASRVARVQGGSPRAPVWEALGGLPDQAQSSSIAVTAST